MEFQILGPLDVRDGDREHSLGGTRQRALLGLLLPNEVVSSDPLVDELWGRDGGIEGAAGGVSWLRKVIGPDVLVTRAPGYELRVDPGQLDVHRFEKLVAEGRAALAAADPDTAADTLGKALALSRGRRSRISASSPACRRNWHGSRSCGWPPSRTASRRTSPAAATPRRSASWRR